MNETYECVDCGNEFERDEHLGPASRCPGCELARALASVEPPEGGWPRGSDMDRL